MELVVLRGELPFLNRGLETYTFSVKIYILLHVSSFSADDFTTSLRMFSFPPAENAEHVSSFLYFKHVGLAAIGACTRLMHPVFVLVQLFVSSEGTVTHSSVILKLSQAFLVVFVTRVAACPPRSLHLL